MKKLLLSCLLAVSASVFADGSGTLNDTTLSLDHEGGPLIVPNPLVLVDASSPPPTCMEGAPTCDTYTLTVDVSDTFRAANSSAKVQFTLAFAEDWDLWLLDGSDAVIASAAGTDNPEVLKMDLKQLVNGVYKVQVTPFFPDAGGFTLNITANGAKSISAGKSGSGLALGAFAPLMLLGLFGLALLRRTA